MAKTYFITNDKKKAKSELKKIFNKYIISDVKIEPKWYKIERISQKDFYKHSLESQKEMDKYLKHLLNRLETPENQVEIVAESEENDEWFKDHTRKALKKEIDSKKKAKNDLLNNALSKQS